MSLNSDRDTGITYTKLLCLLVNLTFVLLITVLFSTLFSLSACMEIPIYTFSIPDNGTIKALDLGTTENNRVYVFRYTAQESKFYSYLPTIEKMIDSFKSLE
jgi:hypothetical protein